MMNTFCPTFAVFTVLGATIVIVILLHHFGYFDN